MHEAVSPGRREGRKERQRDRERRSRKCSRGRRRRTTAETAMKQGENATPRRLEAEENETTARKKEERLSRKLNKEFSGYFSVSPLLLVDLQACKLEFKLRELITHFLFLLHPHQPHCP